MRRRDFTILIAGAAVTPIIGSSPARGQQPDRRYRVGWLGNSKLNTPPTIAFWDAFRLELQRRGWTEGQNVAFEQRFAEGVPERFPQHVRELLELKVDLIVAVGGGAAAAARNATDAIPVVFLIVSDPLRQKLVVSLARPGGNLTGLSSQANETVGKRLELLKEAFPRVVRIAYLPEGASIDEQANQAAHALGLQLLPAPVRQAEDLPSAIAELAHADAWYVSDHPRYFSHFRTVVALIAAQGKPAMYPAAHFVREGGLMSYSLDLFNQARDAAGFVDRILRGAKPADLPVQQPTKFELVINLKTAKALGITISESFLARADEVIE